VMATPLRDYDGVCVQVQERGEIKIEICVV
jgi:hypothetical protein